MAATQRTHTEQVRRDIEAEREQLAGAVEHLRDSLGEATNISGKLKSKLPVVAGAAPRSASCSPAASARRCGYFARRGREGTRRCASAAGRFSTAIERDVGTAPQQPTRLSRGEWVAVFKRTVSQFLADDCMGLAQQVAYSSLLAFFPAVVALVGLLDLINAYDQLRELPRPGRAEGGHRPDRRVPAGLGRRRLGRRRSSSASSARVWAASGAMGSVVKAVNRAYDRMETRPFWKVRADLDRARARFRASSRRGCCC